MAKDETAQDPPLSPEKYSASCKSPPRLVLLRESSAAIVPAPKSDARRPPPLVAMPLFQGERVYQRTRVLKLQTCVAPPPQR